MSHVYREIKLRLPRFADTGIVVRLFGEDGVVCEGTLETGERGEYLLRGIEGGMTRVDPTVLFAVEPKDDP